MDINQLLDQADIMVAMQNYHGAITLYNRIIEQNSNCDEAYLYRGELHGRLGQLEQAFADINRAITIDPGYDRAYTILASLYRSQNQFVKAIEACQKAVEINKNDEDSRNLLVQLHVQLADKLLANHQADQAVQHYQQALVYVPDNIQLLYKHAFAVSRTGDFDKTHALIDQILEKDSRHVPTLSLLAAVYEKTGKLEQGWQVISSLVDDFSLNASINITYGKYAMRQKQYDQGISRLETVIKQVSLSEDDQLSIYMLLGKLYDAKNDYKTAFINFSRANSLAYNDYDIAQFETEISTLIEYFSPEKYAQLLDSGDLSEVCVFILGMPRSGTSLIEQILASHSEFYGAGELQLVPQLLQQMHSLNSADSYPQFFDTIDSDTLATFAKDLVDKMQALSLGESRVSDKLPHNFLFIGLIHKLLPKAKIIHCVRNPLDTCLSCYFQHFGGHHPYAYNLTSLGKYYIQYARLMKHWQEELNIPILNVQYENLVKNTQGEVETLLDYLGLKWEDACLEFHGQERSVNTASYTQVTQKIYTGAINRWQNYEPSIGDLIDVLGDDPKLMNL